MAILHIHSFDELGGLVASYDWLLLDFWAPWCAPCKAMNPVLEQFSELSPETAVVKVNVDESQELAVKFGIRAIPTLILLNRDRFVGQESGSRTLKELVDWIEGLKQESSQSA